MAGAAHNSDDIVCIDAASPIAWMSTVDHAVQVASHRLIVYITGFPLAAANTPQAAVNDVASPDNENLLLDKLASFLAAIYALLFAYCHLVRNCYTNHFLSTLGVINISAFISSYL